MKKFKVYGTFMVSFCKEIEAENKDDAWDIATELGANEIDRSDEISRDEDLDINDVIIEDIEVNDDDCDTKTEEG